MFADLLAFFIALLAALLIKKRSRSRTSLPNGVVGLSGIGGSS
jgi:allophanate hydrolase subunit 1